MVHGSIQTAISECDRRADLGVGLPEAIFDRARLQLFRRPEAPYDGLHSYCRAVAISHDAEPIRSELAAIERLIRALGAKRTSLAEVDALRGFDWIRRVLILGSAVAEVRPPIAAPAGRSPAPPFKLSKKARALVGTIGTAARERPEFAPPVVIVAGGCDRKYEADLRRGYGKLLSQGFADFEGTIICGGTNAGISGMVGDLENRAGGKIVKIAYLPDRKTIPPTDREHSAYRICRHVGRGYSPLGPIQTWADLLLAGLDPADLRVFGVNGGDLSAFEYRLALAMGARVGVIERSGRAASEILPDADWRSEPNLAPLPEDWATVSAFVCAKHPIIGRLSRDAVERTAKQAHGNYQKDVLKKRGKVPDRIVNWEVLPQPFQDSNRNQMAYAMFTLRWAGFDVVPAAPGETLDPKPPLPPGYEKQVEAMAEREHGRYVAERLADGWRRGEDDSSKKTNPTLVPWTALSDETKNYDRNAVRNWVSLFAAVGLKVVPRSN
jgi:hypothetical protein